MDVKRYEWNRYGLATKCVEIHGKEMMRRGVDTFGNEMSGEEMKRS